MPRILAAAALLALATLAAWTGQTQAVAIAVADAAVHEGQTVRVVGVVGDVEVDRDGSTRFALSDGRLALAATSEQEVAAGARVEAIGRIVRQSGRLTLLVEAIRDEARLTPATPSLAQLAAQPDQWVGRQLSLAGSVARDHVVDGEGHAIAVGAGPWPHAGPVQVLGALRYEPRCACYAFDAHEVTPWTS